MLACTGLDVTPGLPAQDTGNGLGTNSEKRGDVFLKTPLYPHLPDCVDLGVGQLCLTVALASWTWRGHMTPLREGIHQIVPLRALEEMGRAYTGGIVTTMENTFAIFEVAHIALIGVTVRPQYTEICGKHPVAIVIVFPNPDPTRTEIGVKGRAVFIHSGPKTVFDKGVTA